MGQEESIYNLIPRAQVVPPKQPRHVSKFNQPPPSKYSVPEPEPPKPTKPPVPKHNEQPLLGMKTNKNFVAQNAVDTIMTVPRKPEKNIVDSRKGTKYPLDSSGLTPVY